MKDFAIWEQDSCNKVTETNFIPLFQKKKKKIGTNWYQAFDLKLLYSCILKAVILDFESQSSLRRKKVV